MCMFKQKNITEIHTQKKSHFLLDLQIKSERGVREPYCSSEETIPVTVCDAGRDLFLWSVLQNQKDLAQITWEQVNIYSRFEYIGKILI